MKVLRRSSLGYSQDPTKYFDFHKYEKSIKSKFILIEAAFEQAHQWEQFNLEPKYLKSILQEKIVRLEFEEPNKFFIGDNPNNYDSEFHKIFTICPYTAKWLNKVQGNKKRVPIFFPFNKKYIPKIEQKKYDVIYTGHIVSNAVLKEIQIISGYNYRFVSNSKHNLVTNRNASYEEKMKLIAQSKVTIVHNQLFPKFIHVIQLLLTKNFRENFAFKNIPKWFELPSLLLKGGVNGNIIVPQLKSRLFEAAFGRSLILCKRDEFNIIERFFTPNKDFIYYQEGELEVTLNKVLRNYSQYRRIIDNAYKKALANYTVDSFVEKFLTKI